MYVYLTLDMNNTKLMNHNGSVNASYGFTCWYTTKLSVGGHSFYFHTMNVKNETARFPSSGYYYVNVSQGSQYAPQLLNHAISPTQPTVDQLVNTTITYKDLDTALAAIESGETEGLDPTLLSRVREMMAASDHKRAMPPVCPMGVAANA